MIDSIIVYSTVSTVKYNTNTLIGGNRNQKKKHIKGTKCFGHAFFDDYWVHDFC